MGNRLDKRLMVSPIRQQERSKGPPEQTPGGVFFLCLECYEIVNKAKPQVEWGN